MEHGERLLRLREAAQVLGISPSLMKRLRREGKVRVVKIGCRAVRVSTREIERLCRRDD
jgi:excisionase family DNA binding protein